MINLAILGYGTIGSGVVESLRLNGDIIARSAGQQFKVVHVLDLREFPGSPIENVLTHDFNDIVNDPEVDIVVEVMGGERPAYDFVKACLEAGKSVVTSNKALIAAYGPELMAIAREKNVNIFFEAAVGGAIPIIRPLNTCLVVDDILEITGILNGTTNYILTKMYDDGVDLEPTLKEAQKLGYAEADPTADIEGYDPQRKIAILATLAYGQFLDYRDIPCTGITGISAADIKYAKAFGCKIKLFATAHRENGRISAEVAPHMARASHPLYNIDDVVNAVKVRGNLFNDITFSGPGAGSLPTASAVWSDIIVASLNMGRSIVPEINPEPVKLEAAGGTAAQYYIRTLKPGQIPEDKLMVEQKLGLPNTEGTAFITGPVTRAELDSALENAEGICNIIKIA